LRIPGAAIDFAHMEVRRLNVRGLAAEYVDFPEDLVGTGPGANLTKGNGLRISILQSRP